MASSLPASGSLGDTFVAVPAPSGRSWLPLALCGGLTFALALLWWAQGGWVFPLDDAYITLHNAGVLLDGHDPNYGVSALVGATSPIHLALVTALATLLPLEAASYVVSGGAVLLLALGLLRLARGRDLPTAESGVFILAGLVTAAPQVLNGLETGLAMAAGLWALILAASERPTRRLAILCGALPFLRPELGVLSLVLLGRQIWLRTKLAPGGRQALPGVLLDAGAALAAAAPWLVWTWLETGAVLPNTLGAKLAFFALQSHALPSSLGMTAPFVIGAAGPAVAALALLRNDRLAPALWLCAGAIVLGFALTAPELVGLNGNRYAYALVPVALFALARLAGSRGMTTFRIVLAAQCLFGAFVVPNLVSGLSDAQAVVAEHAEVARWAQANLPPQSRLLIHDAGMVAFATDLELIDVVGLKSPDSVPAHRRWTAPSHGAERALAVDAIASAGSATHALILDDRPNGYWGLLLDDLRRTGWGVDLLHGSGARDRYSLYRLTPPTPRPEN